MERKWCLGTRLQNVDNWMVKPLSAGCVNTVVACGILITSDYILLLKSSSSEKIDPQEDQKQEINFVWPLQQLCVMSIDAARK